MRQIIKIAWRNVWRNKLRSFIVIASMVLGLWSGLFSASMMSALNNQRINSAIKSQLSHLQIHHPSFQDNYDIKYQINSLNEVLEALDENKKVASYSSRIVLSGMASTARGATGVKLIGADHINEKNITDIHSHIVKGTYFSGSTSRQAVIGQELAEKLKLDIKKSIYLTFVNENGLQERLKLKVVGIFKSGNSMFDGSHMFAKKDYLDKIFGKKDIIHEVALVSNDINQVKELKDELLEAFPDNEIELWSEISPELGYANEMLSFFLYIFMTIILIALSFGIINTMLMAVLERKRELGVLMSVGLNKSKIFLMIAFETLFISIVSVPLGVLISYITISYFGDVGIDLSIVEEGLEQFGMGARLYTELYLDYYINITLLTFLLTFISSLFPARRALKLEPAVAVRSI